MTRQELYGAGSAAKGRVMDEFYVSYLSVRAHPIAALMGDAPPKYVHPITSINEDKLLKLLALSFKDRSQIEGLSQTRRSSAPSGNQLAVARSEEQQMMKALGRLVRHPPPEVGDLQRRTRTWLLRPYPLGD